MNFTGVCTALVTPFNDEGVDYKALERLIEFQIKNGADALLICGTTGEPPTMSAEERRSVIDFSVKLIARRVPVFVGSGTNCTATSIESSIVAQSLGADALLVVTPYYNKCTQKGLIAHYRAISDNVNIPIIAYSVPSRTGVKILPETVAELAKIQHVEAFKDANGSIADTEKTINLLRDFPEFSLYSGDDALTIPMLSLGARGLISVASNAIPAELSEMVKQYIDGSKDKALAIHNKYIDFMNAIFIEVSPVPIKAALARMGLCNETVRLPLLNIDEQNRAKLYAVMSAISL